jgi:hypothetical protein
LKDDIPDWLFRSLSGSVVFYLAAWRHVGFIEDLKNIPWSALVFEGHQGDNSEEFRCNISLMERVWDCQLAASSEIADGDCGTRPVAVFVRK